MKINFVKSLKTILPLGLGVFLFWFFFDQMDDTQLSIFQAALKNANYWWIILSVALSILAYLIRAERWKLALEPLNHKSSFANRYHSIMIGYIINLTIPRAGEASRAAMLNRSEKIPFTTSFGTIISERIVDLIFLGSISALTYLLNTQRFNLLFEQIQANVQPEGSANNKWIFISGLIALAMVGFFILKKFKLIDKIITFGKEILQGFLSILKMKKAGLYLFYSFLIWFLYVLYFIVCFCCLKETSNFQFNDLLLAFIAGSLGITFTNGGIGAFPLLVGIVIGIIGQETIPNAQVLGNALGMIIWSSQTLLVIVLGVISLILLPKNHVDNSSTTAAE